MSRLRIETPDQAQLTVERLYKDLERHIIASPPGLCPVDLQLSFLKVCHAQTCGKCVPCRVGLAQLQNLMEDVLAGKADMHTLDLIESTAQNVANSADCAIGFEAAKMVLAGLEGFREDYINHIKKGKCSVNVHHSIPCVALCPAQVDIPGYIALVGAGRYADAVKLIRKDNPFPTACGLICEHPCEARCRRSMIDAPINIRGLKRMAVDNAPSNTVPLPEKQPATNKRIAIIGGDRAISDTSRLRYEGCMQSFTAHGIPFDPKRDYQGVRYSYQAGYQATKALLDKGCRFTAIFAPADVMAIGAIRALQDNGLQVPEDVSVMGVDGLPLSSFLVPRLATVRQTVSMLAKRSVEILLGNIERNAPACHETVPFEILSRESIREISH